MYAGWFLLVFASTVSGHLIDAATSSIAIRVGRRPTVSPNAEKEPISYGITVL